MDYTKSSHLEKWILSPNELQRKRVAAYAMMKDDFKDSEDDIEHLTDEEVRLIALAHLREILNNGEKLALSYRTIYCAMIFFKRFCLTYPITRFNLGDVALSCLFLAGKVEEEVENVALRRLQVVLDLPKQRMNEVLKNEMAVLSGSDYSLIVYGPMKQIGGMVGYDQDKMSKCWEKIRTIAMTDIPFRLQPVLLSLYAIKAALTDTEYESAIARLFGEKNGLINRLSETFDMIAEEMEKTSGILARIDNGEPIQNIHSKYERNREKYVFLQEGAATEELEKKKRKLDDD